MYERPDREKSAVQVLEKSGVDFTIHRFHKKSPGWVGCLTSHLSLYKLAFEEKGLDYVVVCEDNISCPSDHGTMHCSVPSQDQTFSSNSQLLKFLNTNKDWDVVYLGGYVHNPLVKLTELPEYTTLKSTLSDYGAKQSNVYKLHYTKSNHGCVCYALHRRCYEKILAISNASVEELVKSINMPIDNFLGRMNAYVYSPFLFHHSHSISSTVNAHLDKLRWAYFHPKTMKVLLHVYFNQKFYRRLLSFIVICIIVYVLLRLKRKT